MPLNDGMHLAGTMEFGGIRLLSCPAEVIRHMQSLVDGRPADHSAGAGTSVNSCTGSKVNEQLRSQGSLSSRGETVSSRRPVVRAASSARLAWDG